MAHSEFVVLVHGLWMHGIAMRLLESRIAALGYATRAHSYRTVRVGLRENVTRLVRYCSGLEARTVHLVGHSMGGIVALNAACALPLEKRGRVVLIGTPYAGSYSGRVLDRSRAGRAMLGRCMGEWLNGPQRADVQHVEFGVIAGDGGIGLGRVVARGLQKPHDGVVSVAETRVPGMRDHITLHVSHTAMLVSADVARQVCAFLRHGRFEHGASSP